MNRLYRSGGKRLLDFIASVVLLVLSSPVIALTALLVRLGLGRGVLYRDARGGLNGTTFTLYKFRTMREARGDNGNLLPDGERITRLGNWLRALSLDELPQLWNVLRGDISLVGPRPLVARYLTRYTAQQARRHEVRPGITGWAQVNGRNAISWDEKFALDVWYVDHLSFGTDLRIILATIWAVLRKSNIAAAGHVTMPEFAGGDRPMIADRCANQLVHGSEQPVR